MHLITKQNPNLAGQIIYFVRRDPPKPTTYASNTNLMKQNSGFSYVEENDHAKLLMPGVYLANIPATCFILHC